MSEITVFREKMISYIRKIELLKIIFWYQKIAQEKKILAASKMLAAPEPHLAAS